MKHVDLTGKRFGRLLVLERLPHTEKLYKYKCLCDCGNIIEAKAVNLKSRSGLDNVLRGTAHSAGGYFWMYLDQEIVQ